MSPGAFSRSALLAGGLLLSVSVACESHGPLSTVQERDAAPGTTEGVVPLETAAPTRAPRATGGASNAASSSGALPPLPPKPFGVTEVPGPDRLALRELSGVSLTATWSWPGIASKEGLAVADVAQTGARWRITLAGHGRMRVDVVGAGLSLPEGATLGARLDRYGTVLTWPSARRHRIVAVGALRSLLGERRVDVSPLSPGQLSDQGRGRWLGLPTRQVTVRSALGSVTLQLATVPEAASGAPLWCRLLVEIVGVHPATPSCRSNEVAMRASYQWADGPTAIEMRVVALAKRAELEPTELAVPPRRSSYRARGLPELPPWEVSKGQGGAAQTPSVVALNQSDMLMVLLIDDAVQAVIKPHGSAPTSVLPGARHKVVWRSILGDVFSQPVTEELAAQVVYGAARAAKSTVE